MVAMKKTLLELVQSILNELDSDTVNSIDDTVESTQVAKIVAATYFDLISNKTIPEHRELFRLDALADSTRPNYLKLPSNVEKMETFWYDKSDAGTFDYREIDWVDPLEFMRRINNRSTDQDNVIVVPDINASTELLIVDDKMPQFFTTFDDLHIVCDSYDAGVESTLQNSRTKAYGILIPTVSLIDTFTFDIDADFFPYLEREALSRAYITLQKTANEKAEQWSRRHKARWASDRHRFNLPNIRNNYGRNSRSFRKPR